MAYLGTSSRRTGVSRPKKTVGDLVDFFLAGGIVDVWLKMLRTMIGLVSLNECCLKRPV